MALSSPVIIKDIRFRLNREGPSIDARIYTSKTALANPSHLNLAVVAHPYGPLGGSYDDATVLLVVKTLLNANYLVGTFNFCHPSWTLKPELADFAAFSTFLMLYGSLLQEHPARTINFLAAGYSYGSLVASQVLPASQLLVKQGEAGGFLLEQAAALASEQAEAPPGPATTAKSLLSGIALSTSYLLISPLLSPITNLVAPFNRRGRFLGRSGGKTQNHPALAVFGTQDALTSSRRLERWAIANEIEFEVLEGASHFWQDHRHRIQLADAVNKWLMSINLGNIGI